GAGVVAPRGGPTVGGPAWPDHGPGREVDGIGRDDHRSDPAGDRDVTGRVLARLHPAAGIVAVVVGLGGGISVAIANAVTVAVAGRAGPRVAAAEGVEVLVVVVGARAAREQQRERHEFEDRK